MPTLLNAEEYEELALAVRVPSPVQHLMDDRLRAAGVLGSLGRRFAGLSVMPADELTRTARHE